MTQSDLEFQNYLNRVTEAILPVLSEEVNDRFALMRVIIQVPPKHGMSNAILATPKWFPEGESVEPTEECPRPTQT